ncbi:trypsin-like peptidase domain-containing protein [Flavobacterium agricola]|uniref:Trypsin-like peptidase domain-containing protein n=1 Tax=Flavobacterium agricola TaxID=2870839 RepID=A0ABY6LYL7_9FLAO|nr:trypsin-like peptidase domain-containing protein [Flavobacterium agricola]UYW01430.1 trypsin-like peptidase domain-containing protein [Flavobacterium agricola]
MNKITSLFTVSVLSGVITLGAYKLLFDKEVTNTQAVVWENKTPQSVVKSVNYAAESTDFSNAAEAALDFVVHVKNINVSKYQTYSLQDFMYGYQPQTKERKQVGSGSGVIISEDGYVVTNNHVIQNATELEVTLNNNKTYKAQVVGTDSKMDIALLKLDTNDTFNYAVFGNSDAIRVGEWVLAVGNPYNLNSTVTAGIVSAKARNLTNDGIQSFIQTDAAINPGNSGGALVNVRGELIGINTMITSTTGSYVGYAFAVPSNITKKIIEDLVQYGNVQHATIGIEGGELNAAAAKELNLDVTQGFYVNRVMPNSGAEKAGIKSGDVIIQLDDQKVNSFSALSSYLNSKRPDEEIDITLLRKGKEIVAKVKLSKKELGQFAYNGILLENITPQDKQKFRINDGVKIAEITNPDFIEYASILTNSIIIRIDGQLVKSAQDANKLLAAKSDRQKTRMEIITPNGKQLQLIL